MTRPKVNLFITPSRPQDVISNFVWRYDQDEAIEGLYYYLLLPPSLCLPTKVFTQQPLVFREREALSQRVLIRERANWRPSKRRRR